MLAALANLKFSVYDSYPALKLASVHRCPSLKVVERGFAPVSDHVCEDR